MRPSGRGAYGWERRVQRVPASGGSAISPPSGGQSLTRGARAGEGPKMDIGRSGHCSGRCASFCSRFCICGAMATSACAAVKISALPRTCIRRYRGCNIRSEPPENHVALPRLSCGLFGRGDGSPRAHKTPGGARGRVFIQNTRTLKSHAPSPLSFVSAPPMPRVVLGQNTRVPRGRSHFTAQAAKLWLWLREHATPSPCSVQSEIVAGAAINLARRIAVL